MKKLNVNNKRNIKCETCEYSVVDHNRRCKLTGEQKFYYNRCRKHEFKKKYLGGEVSA